MIRAMSLPAISPPSPLRERLLDAILRLSFARGRFRLASGAWSDYYLDLRRTTLDPTGLTLATGLLWRRLADSRVTAIGGPTLGADPLVAGLLCEAHRRSHPLLGFLVRGSVKDHGTGRQIEGHCPPGSRVAVIDDVCTRGGSLLRAIEAVRATDAEPVLALALVDRNEGGREAIESEGVAFHPLFQIEEVLARAKERNL
jgi:orotate phosphoribosyltransferase